MPHRRGRGHRGPGGHRRRQRRRGRGPRGPRRWCSRARRSLPGSVIVEGVVGQRAGRGRQWRLACRERTAGGARATGAPVGLSAWRAGGVPRWPSPSLSVLFPPRCVGCGDFETYLCPRCRGDPGRHRRTTAAPAAGSPGPGRWSAGRCSHCMGMEFGVRRARGAPFVIRGGQAAGGGVQVRRAAGPGPLMAELARPAFDELRLARSAPRGPAAGHLGAHHRAAQRERGYNQAELLARALAGGPAAARPWPAWCARPQATQHQKGLGRAGRQSNLRGAFVLRRGGGLSGCRRRPAAVILVDDVYTTGATAQEVSSRARSGHRSTSVRVHVLAGGRRAGAEGHD